MRKIVALLSLLIAGVSFAQPERFAVTIHPDAFSGPYSGRIYVVFGDQQAEPRTRLNAWFNPPPAVAWDVENVMPGEEIILEGFDLYHAPEQAGDAWRTGEVTLQAVARVSLDNPRPGTGAGDLYSTPITLNLDQAVGKEVSAAFILSEVVEEQAGSAFEPDEQEKKTHLFELESKLLSEFHGRRITMTASVNVPDSWNEETLRRYPIVYYITGFGGNENEVMRYMGGMPHKEAVGDVIVVGLDATNYWGHSVFADSAVTGPWGEALTSELIPALEAEYRGPENADHRYVTGISSGGWGSLWVQVAYPDVFAGVWSHVPDPVDFRAFQTVDITADNANIYTDENGERRPLGRNGEQIMFWADDFIARETMLGPGGQIQSFEAVFSPALENGNPAPLFDRETGSIDPKVAKAWEKYDIRLKLEREWDETGEELAGKLHVFGGSMDNFYLGEAVGMLKESLDELGADAEIEVIEGMAHTFYWPGDKRMWEIIHERWADTGG